MTPSDLNRQADPRSAIEKRKPLTRAEALQLLLDQNGFCGCGCGVRLQPMTEGVIDEHYRPLGLLGTNDYGNRKLYRKPCAKTKTNGRERGQMVKAKRQAGETGQQARRERRGEGSIKSRGFDKTKSRGFDGKIRERAPR